MAVASFISKLRNKVCRTKAGEGENSLTGLALRAQNLASQFVATEQTSRLYAIKI